MKPLYLIITLAFISAFAGCKKEEPQQTAYEGTLVHLQTPYGFPILDNPEENRLTEEGITLGRRLYYDIQLHPDKQMSCADCHHQENSFSTYTSNALPHVNLGWNEHFLWNGKIEGSLEDVMAFEIDEFFNSNLTHIKADPTYPPLYQAAFGSKEINLENSARAMAQFLRSMISANSKYDQYLRGETTLSDSEMRGLAIFNTEKGDCFHCHALPATTDFQFHNIGLDSIITTGSSGRHEVTGKSVDKGKFKTPTLRNIEFTAPYMHDGRFNSLDEVINFYDHQMKESPNLDPIFYKTGKLRELKLTPQDKEDLKNFLKTLTDYDYLENPDFSDPFK